MNQPTQVSNDSNAGRSANQNPASESESDFTTSPRAMAFWILTPIALVVLFAIFSELTGAK